MALLGPDFIIIGAMKSGTTTLYRWLAGHPDIGMSRDKETDFFVAQKNFDKGMDWYAKQFPPQVALRGEASPNYSKRDDFEGVPERIHAGFPGVKLLYIVRDPVSRFVSQYRHSWTIGDIALSPAELMSSDEYDHILGGSRYAHQLMAYRAMFPDEQILVLDFADMKADPDAVHTNILEFIGAAPRALERGGVHNDSQELSRVPPGVLRFAQSPLGKRISGLIDRRARDRIRGVLAFGKARQPEPFTDEQLEKIRDDLQADAAQFREMTGLPFRSWVV